MNYLFHVQFALTPKNNLEKEVYEYLKQGNRLPVSTEGMERLQQAMLYYVQNLNLKHKRCSPVALSFQPLKNGDIALFIGHGDVSSFRATFLKVAEVWARTEDQ